MKTNKERERPVPVYPMQRLTSPSVVHLGIEACLSEVEQHPFEQCEPAKSLTSLTYYIIKRGKGAKTSTN